MLVCTISNAYRISTCAYDILSLIIHCAKKPVTTMLTYPWKCTVLHCNHLGNTWKPLVLMTRHFDYCPSASEGDNQSVRSSAPVVSRCFPGGYNVKLYISRGRLAWWLLAFLCCDTCGDNFPIYQGSGSLMIRRGKGTIVVDQDDIICFCLQTSSFELEDYSNHKHNQPTCICRHSNPNLNAYYH